MFRPDRLRLVALLLLLLCLVAESIARKDKMPKEEDMSPAPTISPTDGPTLAPTAAETEAVVETASPTRFPTMKPSAAPIATSMPTLSPIVFMPLDGGVTADATTTAPTAVTSTPTVSPTVPPTLAATEGTVVVTRPPEQENVVNDTVLIELPDVTFELAIVDLFEEELVRNLLIDFVTQTLASTSSNALEIQELGAAMVNYNMTSGHVTFKVQGFANVDESLTVKDIQDALVLYFKFFGLQDLLDYLVENDVSVQSLSVIVAQARMGPLVSTQSNNAEVSAFTAQSTATKDDSPNYAALTASVVTVAAAVVILAIVLAVRHRRNSSIGKDPVIVMDLAPRDIVIENEPLPPHSPPRSDIEEVRSFSGLLSLEDSLFTTDNSLIKSPPPNFQYDASRLDQVIISAKGLSRQLESQASDRSFEVMHVT